jgi:hypothetical protein
VEGPGGSLLVGRALSLFGRGATEIDFLYGHGYAVGAPTGFSDSGPSGGHLVSGLSFGGAAPRAVARDCHGAVA